MTVKAERQPEQDLDSHTGDSLDCRGPLNRLPDYRERRDDYGSHSILDFVEYLQIELGSPSSLPTVWGGGDNRMKPVATAPSR
jgi:hypothetical protein